MVVVRMMIIIDARLGGGRRSRSELAACKTLGMHLPQAEPGLCGDQRVRTPVVLLQHPFASASVTARAASGAKRG